MGELGWGILGTGSITLRLRKTYWRPISVSLPSVLEAQNALVPLSTSSPRPIDMLPKRNSAPIRPWTWSMWQRPIPSSPYWQFALLA